MRLISAVFTVLLTAVVFLAAPLAQQAHAIDCPKGMYPKVDEGGFEVCAGSYVNNGGPGSPPNGPDNRTDEEKDEDERFVQWCNALALVGEPLPEGCPVEANPQVVAFDLWKRWKPPLPDAKTAPPRGSDAAVGLPTWVWIDPGQWEPVQVQDTDGGVTVQITATPERIVIEPGPGLGTVECDGPGTPYDPGADADAQETTCSYTYLRSSAGLAGGAYQMQVTVVWSGRWSGPGGAGGEFPDTVSATTQFPIRVAEGQALN